MVAEMEGLPDNIGEIIVLFKKNDIILARRLPGHETYLSLCAWRNYVMEFKSTVEKLYACRIEKEQHIQRDVLGHWTLTG